MKKIMMLAAMLAMMVVASAPAIAQESTAGATAGDESNTTVSGNVVITQTQAASLTQDCRTIVTVNNTGTATGGDQYSDSGDTNQTVQVNFGNTTVNVTGAQCQQIVTQVQAGKDAVGAVTAVIGTPAAPAPGPAAPKENPVPAVTTPEKTMPENTVPEKTVQQPTETSPTTGSGPYNDSGESILSVLPDTGGASLLVLGTGALLVSGGLLVRRFLG